MSEQRSDEASNSRAGRDQDPTAGHDVVAEATAEAAAGATTDVHGVRSNGRGGPFRSPVSHPDLAVGESD